VLKKLIPEIRAAISDKLDQAPVEFLRLQQMQDALEAIEPVVIVGTRFGESTSRDKRMTARGDVAGLIRRNTDGFLTLPLIADFTLDEVWETLALSGQAAGAAIYAFAPDFNATRDLYRDATGECVIVAGERAAQSSACGARMAAASVQLSKPTSRWRRC
jgi:hypothetical protein